VFILQYRKFPNLDWKPSALGFGAMRLPVIDGDQSNVDVPEATRIIRYAIDHGVNYLDTAYFYHGGNAEQALGQALRDGYRQKIKLATKFPAREVKSSADFDSQFAAQLERLETDKIDFYLLHGLNRHGWARLRDMGVLPWLERMVAKGHLEYLGFSFHDDYEIFRQIVDAYDNWTFCQVQFNYMDVDYQAGYRGVQYAAGKGMGVIVMEPLRGGQLAKQPPEAVAAAWKTAPENRSPIEWAFRWLWSHPEVTLVLSGMSAMEQVVENVKIAGHATTDTLTAEELSLFERVREAYKGLCPIPCTGCRYCMPCPNGVEIPVIFRIYNDMKMYDDVRMAKWRYNGGPWGLTDKQDARNCIDCGQCSEACPQHIPVAEWLKKAHEELISE
jgi:predicted aldo/keto reductase-like oxidoreductase